MGSHCEGLRWKPSSDWADRQTWSREGDVWVPDRDVEEEIVLYWLEGREADCPRGVAPSGASPFADVIRRFTGDTESARKESAQPYPEWTCLDMVVSSDSNEILYTSSEPGMVV